MSGPGRERGPSGFGAQFMRPTGLLGRLAGWLMARGNQPANQTAADLLDVRPDDQVLEIGFGPGVLIQILAARAAEGFVAGVDPSDVMVRQAAGRNREAIRRGRVELRQGTASRLPYPDGRFTKACAVNSFQFWATPEEDLREVRRVLRDGGLLLLGLRSARSPGRLARRIGLADAQILNARELARRAGFHDVRTEERLQSGEVTVYVLART